jgi:hypothetical protein
VPELALAVRGGKSWLRFRWYKLTSDLKAHDWVGALMRDRPPPLAVISGSSSDLAIELAQHLQEHCGQREAAPLLLLTQATSDEVRFVPLHRLYPGRTFRFCFTNRQMAEEVIDFLWSQDDLRPDADPVYVALWEDDTYSGDLTGRFLVALRQPALRAAAQDWAAVTAAAATGGWPLDPGGVARGQFRLATLPVWARVPYSVGAFARPNRWEADAAEKLAGSLTDQQQRPLLVLPATSQPARRFLYGLSRNSPVEARRFIVATGDAIAFNTVYRDRDLAWPIQDLPFRLVFFCHRNPTDARAGFRPEGSGEPPNPNAGSPATGTEDLLLYADIVEALVQSAYQGSEVTASPGDLGVRLRETRLRDGGRLAVGGDGRPLFDANGNRNSGTGEHVVCLRPDVAGGRQLPRATITVWAWQPGPEAHWRLSRPPLPVEYDETPGPARGEGP